MQPQTLLLVACVIVFVVALPLVFKLVPPNRLYGFRTATTLSRTDVWYRSNVFTGLALMVASVLSTIIIFFVPTLSGAAVTAIFVGLILGAAVVSFAYLKCIA